jgi:WD40 repeat protein
LTIWDPMTDGEVVLQDCEVGTRDFLRYAGNIPGTLGSECPDGSLFAGVSLAVSPDGSSIAAISADPASDAGQFEPGFVVQVWDTESGALTRTIEGVFDYPMSSDEYRLENFGEGWLAVFDGGAGSGDPNQVDIIDLESGDLLAELEDEVPFRESFAISPDGSSIYLVTERGEVFEYETTTWESTRSWPAMEGRPRGLAMRPDGRFLATSGEDEVIAIWDLTTDIPSLVDRIPMGAWPSDIMWLDDDHMGAGLLYPDLERIQWRVVDLDASSVVDTAREGLIRDFEPEECRTYEIARCDLTAP